MITRNLFDYRDWRLLAMEIARGKTPDSLFHGEDGKRATGEATGRSTVEARAAIIVNFLLASWRIRVAAERAGA